MVVVGSLPVGAQTSPYAGLESREIKALSADEIAAYESGLGMGLAMAAELNGYPGPKHVLELQETLELDAAQLERTRAVFEQMRASAVDLGRQIVELERQLDRAFAETSIDGERLQELVTSIAERQGRLRLTNLGAHLQMMEILGPEQIHRYFGQRGYHGRGEHRGHASGRHSNGR
jgi:Spy/CpxP family protein refolding chaperone